MSGVDQVSFSGLFRRRHRTALIFRVDDICWGVKRRTGFSEIDDPLAHRTARAHAYVAGNDRLALCGYRPYRWARKQPLVSLAVPTLDNPECLSCRAAMSSALSLVVQPDMAGRVTTRVLQAIELPNPLGRLDDYAPSTTHRRARRRRAAASSIVAVPVATVPRVRPSGNRKRRKRASATTISTSMAPVAVPVLVEMAVTT